MSQFLPVLCHVFVVYICFYQIASNFASTLFFLYSLSDIDYMFVYCCIYTWKGKACGLSPMPLRALGFGMPSGKQNSKSSFPTGPTGQSALGLSGDLHGPGPCVLHLAPSLILYTTRGSVRSPRSSRTFVYGGVLGPCARTSTSGGQPVKRLLFLASASFLLWDQPEWHWPNWPHRNSGFWAATGPWPVYVDEGIGFHLSMF